MVGNEFKIEGDFLYLAHNTDFDYWLFGSMEYRIDRNRTRTENILVDRAEFLPFGSYDIITDGGSTCIRKKTTGFNSNYGFSGKELKGTFDYVGARKRAYRTTSSKLIGQVIGINSNIKSIKGGDKVKVYKKKPSHRKFSNNPKHKHNCKCKKH